MKTIETNRQSIEKNREKKKMKKSIVFRFCDFEISNRRVFKVKDRMTQSLTERKITARFVMYWASMIESLMLLLFHEIDFLQIESSERSLTLLYAALPLIEIFAEARPNQDLLQR